MRIVALCHSCAKQHPIEFDPVIGPAAAFGDWLTKHPQPHETEFRSPRRNQRDDEPEDGWLKYLHNADVKAAYGSSSAYTIGVASLATSSTWLAGREGTAVSNTSNLYLDYEVAGHVCVGTTPTTNTQIQIWAYGSQNDTPVYPSGVTGSDANLSIATAELRNGGLRPVSVLSVVATTSDVKQYWAAGSLAACFGMPAPPKNHGLWIVHNTGVNLNSTAGNHIQSYTGIYATVA